jgi:heme O synthase-like polyprenyltransferase
VRIELTVIAVVYLLFAAVWDHNNWLNTLIKLVNLILAVVAFSLVFHNANLSVVQVGMFTCFSLIWNYLGFKFWKTDSDKNELVKLFLSIMLFVQFFGFTMFALDKKFPSHRPVDTNSKMR